MKQTKKRRSSIEVEIEREARRIMERRQEDAFKAAALTIVARKLDEINALLRRVGYAGTPVGRVVEHPQAAPAPVEHPCCLCGRPGVRKTRPDRFNPTGSWYCVSHEKIAIQNAAEAAQDERLHEEPATNVRKMSVVKPAPPAQMKPETPPQEAPGSGSLTDAFANLSAEEAMGIN